MAVKEKQRKIFPGFLIILALALAAGALYLAYSGRNAGISERATLDNVIETTDMLDARLGELEVQIDQLRDAQDATSRSLLDLTQQLPGSNEDWALAEVEFLLILAAHHAQLEHDPAAALESMQTAELRLRGLDSTTLGPVREQLARDIDRLQEVNSPDISSLALLLGDLAERADSLPLAGAVGTGGKSPAPAVTEKQENRPRGLVETIWRELRNLVVIRHDEGVRPSLLLPGQEYFVYQNLRLELESARLSLLRRDSDNLHASVAFLQKWLEEYFAKDSPAVINVMASLQPLSSINLDPPIPDISSSLESLRAYMRDKAAAPARDEENRTPHT